MIRNIVCLASFLALIGCALPIQAQQAAPETSNCSFTFKTGANNTFLQYCVTANGNIPQVITPFGHPQMGGGGEGYGLCQESDGAEYHDYATNDTGDWGTATVVSLTKAAVKIARSTSDGRWTLTQTITKVGSTSSIKIVMALTNNQAVDRVAYLSRYADVNGDGIAGNAAGATVNSASAWSLSQVKFPLVYGLQLQNVGTPPFVFWHAFAKKVSNGPNACSFADNDTGGVAIEVQASLVMSYVGTVPAGQTKTVTMTYRGL